MKRLFFGSFLMVLVLTGYAFASNTSTWDTDYDSMTLVEDGSSVAGTYGSGINGMLTGTLQDNVFTGWWKEDENDSGCGPDDAWGGQVVFQFSEDGTSFSGDWNYCSDTGALDPTATNWTGVFVSGSIDLTGSGGGETGVEAGGGQTCSGASTGTLSALTDGTLHISLPSMGYQTLFGTMYFWVDLQYVPTSDGKIMFELKNYGSK